MDSWATDGFYSHFPSYSQQPNQREILAKARQLDYQTFLSRISPQKNRTHVKSQKKQNDGQNKKPKKPTNPSPNTNNNELPKLDVNIADENDSDSSTEEAVMSARSTNRSKERNEFVDLPDIFNDERISARNEKMAEEKRLRNIQYKQELMDQIEQKKRERELQRLKEEEEEQRLTKKMEEQLKSVRLQDELDFKPRRRDHHLISIEINKPIINTQCKKLPATVRNERFQANAYRAYDQRKAQSDHGKENCEAPKRSDKEIYNFFTNSARNQQLNDIRHSHYFDLDESSGNEAMSSFSSSTYNTYPLKSSIHQYQNESRQALCNFCKHNRFLTRNQEENMNNDYICGACENDPICLNCRQEICVRCKRLTRNDEHSQKQPFHLKHRKYDNKLLNHVPSSEYPSKMVHDAVPGPVHIENLQPVHTDEDESLSDQSSTTIESKPPYSFNIHKSSVFHPSRSQANRRLSVSIRNGEVCINPDSLDELKRITEEKMLKLSKTYAETIKANKSIESKNPEQTYESILNSKPQNSLTVPTLRENTKRLIEFAKELERNDCNLHERERCDEQTELKNQNSAAQKKTIVEYEDANTSTLTQIGAITKEMQFDRLNH